MPGLQLGRGAGFCAAEAVISRRRRAGGVSLTKLSRCSGLPRLQLGRVHKRCVRTSHRAAVRRELAGRGRVAAADVADPPSLAFFRVTTTTSPAAKDKSDARWPW